MEDDCATCQVAPVVIHGFQQAETIPSHRQFNMVMENSPFLVRDTSSNTWVFHGHVGHVSFQWCALPKLATAGSPQNGEGHLGNRSFMALETWFFSYQSSKLGEGLLVLLLKKDEWMNLRNLLCFLWIFSFQWELLSIRKAIEHPWNTVKWEASFMTTSLHQNLSWLHQNPCPTPQWSPCKALLREDGG